MIEYQIVTTEGGGNINQPFGLGEPFVLAFVRVHFVSGSGTAALDLVLDSQRGSDWDVTLKSFPARGSGADLHYIVPDCLLNRWVFSPQDKLSLTWTDPGTSVWAIEIGLIPWRLVNNGAN